MKNKRIFVLALFILSTTLLVLTIITKLNDQILINKIWFDALIFIGFLYSISGILISLYLLLKK